MSERDELEEEERHLIGEQDRAAQATGLLNHPLLRAAMEAINDRANYEYNNVDPTDLVALQSALLKKQAAEELLNEISEHIRTGDLAAEQLGWVREQIAKWKDKGI